MSKAYLTDSEKFSNLLMEFEGVKYEWGKASLYSSDCSGSLGYCLNLVYGTDNRFTADDYYKKFFTVDSPLALKNPQNIAAMFFLDKDTRKAVHVAGRISKDFYVNVSSIEKNHEGHIRQRQELLAMYDDFIAVERVLDVKKWLETKKVG